MKPPFPDMDELLQRLLDDQIRPDEMKRLQEAMLEDPRVRDYYIDSIFTNTVIRRYRQMTDPLSESDLLQSLSDGKSRVGSRRITRNLYSIAAFLLIGALILISTNLFRQWMKGPAIGTLAGAYKTQWRGSRLRAGESLFIGSYNLSQGIAKMELNQGTSLLLEAPCEVELTSIGEVNLRSGRLTVMVSPQAKGFRVRTSTALITDLGTEFGVMVHPNGSTETHVLKGRVNIELDPSKADRSTSQIVNEGFAAVVEPSGRTIQGEVSARQGLFLLQLPPARQPSSPTKQLNLADIVGGGNGKGTGKLNWGISLKNGQAFRFPATGIFYTSGHPFQPCPQIRGIDGVFIPNGSYRPNVISSTGLIFSKCPKTSGTCFGGPANSGKFLEIVNQQTFTARLNGVTFGTSRDPALSIHPNAGISFDLDEIRRDHPNIRIERFTALCGIPKDLPQIRSSSADVWILVDGVVTMQLHYPLEQHVVNKVDVPIPAQARFLTLASTCPRDAEYSWIIFGYPFIGPAATVQEREY